MKKELILTAIVASAITLSVAVPTTLHFSNQKSTPHNFSNRNHKYLNKHEKKLEIATSEATTRIMQYFNFQDLNPSYTNPDISLMYSKIPFYNINVKNCYLIKTSVESDIKTIFLDKENLSILYNNLYSDLAKRKSALEEELNSMYLNKKLINSSSVLKEFLEKYSLFNNIKDYKKMGDSLCGALIFQYGNLEVDGKFSYSHEYFFK